MRRLPARRADVSCAVGAMFGAAALCASLAQGCADWSRPPLMAGYDADAPLVQEQAPLGFDAVGNAAAVQLVDAERRPPQLELVVLDGRGGPTRLLERAKADRAVAVASELRARGAELRPLLREAAERIWPEALSAAVAEGFADEDAERERPPWTLRGTPAAGAASLSLRVAFDGDRDPPALSVLLSLADAPANEIELARQPVAGARVGPTVWVSGPVVWLLSGSVAQRDPLRRMVGLRRGSLSRGEAALYDAAGRSDRAAGDLAAARRQFDRALAADPDWFDALYDAAAAAAAARDDDEAVALLRRAARADPRRIQVVGRDDDDLRTLRSRADVRALLGMKRPPPDR